MVVVGAGLAGLVAARDLGARRAPTSSVLEARDRVGGRTLNADRSATASVVEIGGQWIGPTQDRVAALAAELGVETFPTYPRARTCSSSTAACAATGDDPAARPARRWSTSSSARWRAGPTRRAASTRTRPGRRRTREKLDSITFAHWLRARHAHRDGAAAGRGRRRRPSGGPTRRTSPCCTRSATCARGTASTSLMDIEGGAAAGPLRRRLPADLARRARRARRPARDRRARRRGSPVGGGGRDGRGGGVAASRPGGRSSRSRRRCAARIEFEPGLPPARPQLAQRMPSGWILKVHRGLRRAVLARPTGSAARPLSDAGPATLDLRQLALRTARRASWSASSAARDAAAPRGARDVGAPRARSSTASRGSSARGRAAAERFIEQDWAAERWSAGGRPRQLHARRAAGPRRRRRCASRSARSTGQGPRRRASGRATWTERSARASAPPPRSSPRSRSLPAAPHPEELDLAARSPSGSCGPRTTTRSPPPPPRGHLAGTARCRGVRDR